MIYRRYIHGVLNMSDKQISNSDILLYQTEDGKIKIDVRLDNETVWLSLNQMAELFQRDKSVILRHIKNVFNEGELNENLTVANFATVQEEGGRKVERNVTYYNLDVIISVGYRVKSHRGTQFRIGSREDGSLCSAGRAQRTVLSAFSFLAKLSLIHS